MRFEIYTMVRRIQIYWDVSLCCKLSVYGCSEIMWCLYLQKFRCAFFLVFSILEYEGSAFFQNVRNQLLHSAVSYPGRPDFSSEDVPL